MGYIARKLLISNLPFSISCFSVSGIHAVHDVTVAYPYNIPESEVNLLNGEFPREVHFHIKRYSIDEVSKRIRLKKFFGLVISE